MEVIPETRRAHDLDIYVFIYFLLLALVVVLWFCLQNDFVKNTIIL